MMKSLLVGAVVVFAAEGVIIAISTTTKLTTKSTSVIFNSIKAFHQERIFNKCNLERIKVSNFKNSSLEIVTGVEDGTNRSLGLDQDNFNRD